MTLVFIKGDDETLVAQSVQAQVKDLVGDGDRSLLVEELTEQSYGDGPDPSLAALVRLCRSLPTDGSLSVEASDSFRPLPWLLP